MNYQKIINDILKENRNYGRLNTNNKIKIAILNPNTSLSTLINIDILSRILSYSNNELTVDYYVEGSIDKIKKDLDSYRINFNNYFNKEALENNIEELLYKLRYNKNCNIVNNCLYLNDNKLVEENGEYTDYLRIINYYNTLNNYDTIIILCNKFNKYKDILKEIINPNTTIKNIDIKDNDLVKNNDINIIRKSAIATDINLNKIDDMSRQLNKLLNKNSSHNLVTYNSNYSSIEYNIVTLLDSFNKVILEISNNLTINILIEYINKLVNISAEYINELTNKIITNEQEELLKAIKIVLNNSLDLLGIIPIYL